MKIRNILLTSVTGFTLLNAGALLADDPTTPPTTRPPVVVPPGDKEMLRDLKGAPADVRNLIISFDATRDKYLAEQRALLRKLKGATDDQRAAIRQQLQANRDAFLAEMKTFRADLRTDLEDLKGKISRREFQRILDAARDASGGDKPARRGQR